MKKNKRVVFNDEIYQSSSLEKENSSNDGKNVIQLENIVQNLYCPNEIEDIDGVDDGDLYLKGNKVGLAPESVAFLDEQKNYHESNEYNLSLLKDEANTITKSNILNNFNCSDEKIEESVFDSNSSTVISESPSVLEKRSLKPIAANRTPRDFFFIRILGEGAFSTVYFATEVNTADHYAIKVLSKQDVTREKKLRYVLREKDIMASLTYAHGGHPFIVKLYCTFQDFDRLYFAMSYAKHGELLDWLRRLGSFDETVCIFYAAEILVALQFIHSCNIIHRDLKPENILIGFDWHILISDFGTAKILNSNNENSYNFMPQNSPMLISETASRRDRSSFVGTAQYVSPEMLKSEPVGPECDYWALGAIIFQMISGQPPFRAVNEYQIMKKILNLNYTFPDGFSLTEKDLVSRLLVYQNERLGSKNLGGIDSIKNHEYFKDVDWDNLPKRTPPELKPYLPASSGEPAYHSDFQLPENLEPGLNGAAITRLMGLNSLFENVNYSNVLNNDNKINKLTSDSSSIEKQLFYDIEEHRKIKAELERSELLEAQRRNHEYHRFVENNIIIKWGPIDKKKGLFARRRIFLLTEGPRLFYVDPSNMELKGEVPLSRETRTEALNFRTFFVHTPKRTYYLFDPSRSAADWCAKIDEVIKRYFESTKEIK